MTGSRLRVALVQADTVWHDPAANLEKAATAIASAAGEGARLVAFPELFATGFTMESERYAEAIPGPTSERLAGLARRHGLYVVGSAVEKGTPPRNAAFVLDPRGEIALAYRKIHPFSYGKESEHYAGGDAVDVAEVDGVRVGLQICYDLRFPETFRALADRGAEVVIVPANWPSRRVSHWKCLLEARAIENLMAVCGVNRTGRDPFLSYPGESVVRDHQGLALARARGEERTLVADIDVDALRRWRAEFPALRDRRPDVYARLAGR